MTEARRKYLAEWYQKNKEKKKLQKRKWRADNAEKHKKWSREYSKNYRQTSKRGRANQLYNGYCEADLKYKRGECTLTREWIIEHIFSGQKCIYCGDDDWTHLGCDRIDDSQPHTPENVVCACGVCNIVRHNKNMSVPEFIEYRKANRREDDNKLPKPVIVEMNGIKVIRKAGV